ncbi:unnamed protein product [Cunninghamella blakesleeana]
MSFSFSLFLRNGNKKNELPPQQQQQQQQSNYNSSSLREQVYPNLESMISPSSSPTSSTSSRSTRPASISLPILEPEELEDNRCYTYMRKYFNNIFIRSSVVCVPHSRSFEGLGLTKEFVESHCFNASPYYRGQYQTANGKVISLEKRLISTESGYKEPRTIHIMAEEWVYIGNKKILVYMTQRPLEGDPPQQNQLRNIIHIPTCRNSKSDLDFLNMFTENIEPLHELQSSVQKFVDTYVYIRGFNNYAVDKIQHLFIKTSSTIIQRNKLLRDTCRIQSEHDHYLELVENVVMGFLHEKIWIQSLRSILQSQDNYLYSICQAYSKERINLQSYTVSYPISEMTLLCFQEAITCLRRTDADNESYPIPINQFDSEESHTHNNNNNHNNNHNIPTITPSLAFTPLEKVACVKQTLDLISKAVDDYAKNTESGPYRDESYVTTDEMIPLLAYVITHANLTRMASLAFYIEHFKLSHFERSEHSFALVTLKTSINYLKGDPLSLLDSESCISTVSSNSASSTMLSPQLRDFRSRSTSIGSPATSSPTFSSQQSLNTQSLYSTPPSTNTNNSSRASISNFQFHQGPKSPMMSSAIINNINRSSASSLRHRKSHSADLEGILEAKQRMENNKTHIHSGSNYSFGNNNYHAEHSRRGSPSPNVFVRPPIVLSTEPTRKSLDITNEWMLHKHDANKSSSSSSSPDIHSNVIGQVQSPGLPKPQPNYQRRHYQQHSPNHHHQYIKPLASPKQALACSQPLISTTLPAISNSTPLPGSISNNNNNNSNNNNNYTTASPSPSPSSLKQVYNQYNYCNKSSDHHQYRHSLPPKNNPMDLLANETYNLDLNGSDDHLNDDNRQNQITNNMNNENENDFILYDNNNNNNNNIKNTNSTYDTIHLNNTTTNTTMNEEIDSPKVLSSYSSRSSLYNPSSSSNNINDSSSFDNNYNQYIGRSSPTTSISMNNNSNNNSRIGSPQMAPRMITVSNRLSFDGIARRPASICIDTRSGIHGVGRTNENENSEEYGDFLSALKNIDGDVSGGQSGFIQRI